MRVLLVNDDGIDAEGLHSLERSLESFDTWTVAPADPSSGVSQALGLRRRIATRRVGDRRWSVEGTPTDCVKLALGRIMNDSPPQVVVSGVNRGANTANNVFYSGTVAAATEAAFWGFPALAVSVQHAEREPDFDRAASVARRILDEGLVESLPPHSVLNVNVPELDEEAPLRYAWTRTARFGRDLPLVEVEPGENVYVYDRLRPQESPDVKGTDLEALADGLVSLSVLSTDRSATIDPPPFDLSSEESL